tara:strand:+ start:13975 stop:14187 length:213 start_codon:yes stop_codon:yes gene_type:complete
MSHKEFYEINNWQLIEATLLRPLHQPMLQSLEQHTLVQKMSMLRMHPIAVQETQKLHLLTEIVPLQINAA